MNDKIKAITASCQPVFPCWLWHDLREQWIRAESTKDYQYYPGNPATHFSTSATKPDRAPEDAKQVLEDIVCLRHTPRLSDGTASAHEAAAEDICEIENICIGGDYSDPTARAVKPAQIVAILRHHFPDAPDAQAEARELAERISSLPFVGQIKSEHADNVAAILLPTLAALHERVRVAEAALVTVQSCFPADLTDAAIDAVNNALTTHPKETQP
jgi:hypothetical protein